MQGDYATYLCIHYVRTLVYCSISPLAFLDVEQTLVIVINYKHFLFLLLFLSLAGCKFKEEL